MVCVVITPTTRETKLYQLRRPQEQIKDSLAVTKAFNQIRNSQRLRLVYLDHCIDNCNSIVTVTNFTTQSTSFNRNHTHLSWVETSKNDTRYSLQPETLVVFKWWLLLGPRSKCVRVSPHSYSSKSDGVRSRLS